MAGRGERLCTQALAMLESILATLGAQVAALQDDIATTTGATQARAVRRLGGMSTRLLSILAETRKHAARSQQAVARMTPATVLAYLRQIKPEQRAHFGREIEQMDRQESVLS